MTPVPSGTTVLHIGPLKTGTTSVQQALSRAKPALEDRGVIYPGIRADHNDVFRALISPGQIPERVEEAHELLGELEHAQGRTVVVSSEYASTLQHDEAARLIAALPSPIHVVLTLRAFPDLLLSRWQQEVKHGTGRSIDRWLDEVLGHGDSLDFSPIREYRMDDGFDLITRWVSLVGAENMTVVVVDRARPTLVYEFFDAFLGLEPGTLEDPGSLNESLSRQAAEFTRMLGERFSGPDVDPYRLQNVVKSGFVHGMADTPGWQDRLQFPESHVEAACRAGERLAGAVRAAGIAVVGDLDALSKAPSKVAPYESPQLRTVPVATAVAAVGGCVARAAAHPFDAFAVESEDESDAAFAGEQRSGGPGEEDDAPETPVVMIVAQPGTYGRELGEALMESTEVPPRGVLGRRFGAAPPRFVFARDLWRLDAAGITARLDEEPGVERAALMIDSARTRLFRLWCSRVLRGGAATWSQFADEVLVEAVAKDGAYGHAFGREADMLEAWTAAFAPRPVTVLLEPATLVGRGRRGQGVIGMLRRGARAAQLAPAAAAPHPVLIESVRRANAWRRTRGDSDFESSAVYDGLDSLVPARAARRLVADMRLPEELTAILDRIDGDLTESLHGLDVEVVGDLADAVDIGTDLALEEEIIADPRPYLDLAAAVTSRALDRVRNEPPA